MPSSRVSSDEDPRTFSAACVSGNVSTVFSLRDIARVLPYKTVGSEESWTRKNAMKPRQTLATYGTMMQPVHVAEAAEGRALLGSLTEFRHFPKVQRPPNCTGWSPSTHGDTDPRLRVVDRQ
jgi:hypothetical protein